MRIDKSTLLEASAFPGADLRYRLLLEGKLKLRREQGCAIRILARKIRQLSQPLDCVQFQRL